MTPGHIGLAVLAALIWGATFPITRVALDETPPLLFAALRFVFAALFALLVPRPVVSWPKLILTGLLLGVGQYGFLFVSMEQGIQPGLASLLVHTQAFFTVALALLIFHELPPRRYWLAAALSALGLVLLALDRNGQTSLTGLALVLAAGLSGAGGNIVLKSLGRVDMIAVAIWMSLTAPLPLLALSIAFDPGDIISNLTQIGWTTMAALVYSTLLATITAFAIWGLLLTRYPATAVTPFFLLVPVFGISLSVLLLGETFSSLRMWGCGLIFSGLVIALVK